MLSTKNVEFPGKLVIHFVLLTVYGEKCTAVSILAYSACSPCSAHSYLTKMASNNSSEQEFTAFDAILSDYL